MPAIVVVVAAAAAPPLLLDAGLDEDNNTGGEEPARRPPVRMMDPSVLDRIKVDWTPGLAARRDRLSNVEAGYDIFLGENLILASLVKRQ